MRIAIALALAACRARPRSPTPPPGAGDPVADHTISLEDATKGLKGTGTLMAKIDVEQSGKSLGSFTCELFDKQAPKTVANFVGLARGVRPWKDPKTGEWVKKPMYDGTGLPPRHPRVHDPGRRSQGHRHRRSRLRVRRRVRPTADRWTRAASWRWPTAGRAPTARSSSSPRRRRRGSTASTPSSARARRSTSSIKIARVPTGARNMPTEPVTIKKLTITRGAAKKAAGKAAKAEGERRPRARPNDAGARPSSCAGDSSRGGVACGPRARSASRARCSASPIRRRRRRRPAPIRRPTWPSPSTLQGRDRGHRHRRPARRSPTPSWRTRRRRGTARASRIARRGA